MKKFILTLACMTTLLIVSCKESTKDKVEDATEAVGKDIEATTEDAIDAIDSTTTEIENDIEKGVDEAKEKME